MKILFLIMSVLAMILATKLIRETYVSYGLVVQYKKAYEETRADIEALWRTKGRIDTAYVCKRKL